MNQKAVIAMSGGVDSSVAAYLMKEKGYECIGITIKTFNETGDGIKRENTCCSLDDVSDARSVACTLGIRHFLYNFTGQFEEHVMKRFVDDTRMDVQQILVLIVIAILSFRNYMSVLSLWVMISL